MAFYNAQQIAHFRAQLDQLDYKYNDLLLGIGTFAFQNARAREFALQGFIRRVDSLRHCIRQLFAALPPELDRLPTKKRLDDAEVPLHTFVFNVFGCADNLAWAWVEETGLMQPNGQPLPREWVGLGTKNRRVRQSLPQPLRDLLVARQPWFAHLEGLRHALAHRIPLYIPPHAVTPANRARYMELENEINQAAFQMRPGRERRLRREQRRLMFFRPWAAHSFSENTPIMVLHPQMLTDYNTIHELGRAFLTALRNRAASA